MRRLPGVSVALAAALLAAPASAEMAGSWRVTGDISSNRLVFDCHFEPGPRGIAGRCINATTGDRRGKPGKVYPLTRAAFAGSQASWAFPVKVMIMSIELRFTGRVDGNRMAGTVTGGGRTGQFTAVRN